MHSVLSQAHNQWASRPADQSFLTLQALHDAVEARTARAREFKGTLISSLRTEAEGKDIKLVGKSNVPSSLTHWAFSQLSRLISYPAHALRVLPASLATQVINNRLAANYGPSSDATTKLLLDVNGSYAVRALTGDNYTRIWDRDVTRRALTLGDKGWQPAPETQLANGGSTRGLYASDHDVFLFLVDNDRRVFEKQPGGGLSRGIIIGNSEVGDKAWWFLTFLYAYICGNHNIWGVEGVRELRIAHRGNADERAFNQLTVELKKYQDASTAGDEARIQQAIQFQIAGTKDEVLDKLFASKAFDLSRDILTQAYDAAEQHEDWYLASPRSAWGFGNGLTEVARAIPHTDERVRVERAAGKVFELGF